MRYLFLMVICLSFFSLSSKVFGQELENDISEVCFVQHKNEFSIQATSTSGLYEIQRGSRLPNKVQIQYKRRLFGNGLVGDVFLRAGVFNANYNKTETIPMDSAGYRTTNKIWNYGISTGLEYRKSINEKLEAFIGAEWLYFEEWLKQKIDNPSLPSEIRDRDATLRYKNSGFGIPIGAYYSLGKHFSILAQCEPMIIWYSTFPEKIRETHLNGSLGIAFRW